MAKSSSQERRAAWLREFEASGLSLAEFCRPAGLAYSTVLNWRRLAREAGEGLLRSRSRRWVLEQMAGTALIKPRKPRSWSLLLTGFSPPPQHRAVGQSRRPAELR